jgi:hypothetical protein
MTAHYIWILLERASDAPAKLHFFKQPSSSVFVTDTSEILLTQLLPLISTIKFATTLILSRWRPQGF